MKGTALILFSVFALALSGEVELNANGCPTDYELHKTLPHADYCNLFYSCVGGERVQLHCPGDLVFNAEEGVCDWSVNVDCAGKGVFQVVPEEDESKEESNPGGNTDPSAAAEICARSNSDGVLVAHENCNQFYKCDKGLPVALDCPDNLLYNSEAGYCDWPFNVECGDRIIPAHK